MFVLLGIQQFVLHRPHLQIGRHMGKIFQIHVSRQGERILPLGIEGKIIELYAIFSDNHRCLIGMQIHRIEGRVETH